MTHPMSKIVSSLAAMRPLSPEAESRAATASRVLEALRTHLDLLRNREASPNLVAEWEAAISELETKGLPTQRAA